MLNSDFIDFVRDKPEFANLNISSNLHKLQDLKVSLFNGVYKQFKTVYPPPPKLFVVIPLADV